MSSVSRTQENRIIKVIDGLKLFFQILGEGQEAITPEERVERSGIKELQKPLKAEKILAEKPHQRIVDEIGVSEEKALGTLEKQSIKDKTSEWEKGIE